MAVVDQSRSFLTGIFTVPSLTLITTAISLKHRAIAICQWRQGTEAMTDVRNINSALEEGLTSTTIGQAPIRSLHSRGHVLRTQTPVQTPAIVSFVEFLNTRVGTSPSRDAPTQDQSGLQFKKCLLCCFWDSRGELY